MTRLASIALILLLAACSPAAGTRPDAIPTSPPPTTREVATFDAETTATHAAETATMAAATPTPRWTCVTATPAPGPTAIWPTATAACLPLPPTWTPSPEATE